jgi:hypothetical protein
MRPGSKVYFLEINKERNRNSLRDMGAHAREIFHEKQSYFLCKKMPRAMPILGPNCPFCTQPKKCHFPVKQLCEKITCRDLNVKFFIRIF